MFPCNSTYGIRVGWFMRLVYDYSPITQWIHVWNSCLDLVDAYGQVAGKYTSPMDAMGYCYIFLPPQKVMCQFVCQDLKPNM